PPAVRAGGARSEERHSTDKRGRPETAPPALPDGGRGWWRRRPAPTSARFALRPRGKILRFAGSAAASTAGQNSVRQFHPETTSRRRPLQTGPTVENQPR